MRNDRERGRVPPKAEFTPSKAGFTLIELLVVISIIAVLFAVAMPVFENVGRKDTNRAAMQVINTLRLARQHAISKRQWTLVVFPNRDGGGDEDVEKCLKSYAVLAVTNNMEILSRKEQNPDNMQFAFASDWKYLPDGIYFDEHCDTGGTATNGNYLFKSRSQTFKYPLKPETPNVQERPMGVMLFRPNGRAYVMKAESEATGKIWQDLSGSKVYLTSSWYYEMENGKLTAGTDSMTGTNTAVLINNKTGQVNIWDRSND
ncbi:MAG: prepilin-type N-terminal cleavage/methylation domain-containing protein [Opitutae bacterium]|nr:prepilin-type N-terminal cleavage/methylation domain-containing protein [Opitutae bacterium]